MSETELSKQDITWNNIATFKDDRYIYRGHRCAEWPLGTGNGSRHRFFLSHSCSSEDAAVMNKSGRELAAFVVVLARTIGRFERDGLLEREHDGKFRLQKSVQRLLNHFMTRERWAFQQLRRHRIFNESWGDVFEPHRHS